MPAAAAAADAAVAAASAAAAAVAAAAAAAATTVTDLRTAPCVPRAGDLQEDDDRFAFGLDGCFNP